MHQEPPLSGVLEPIPPWLRNRYLVLVGLLLYCFLFQGTRGLYEPDEGRYTNVALEMIRLNDWGTPHLHFERPHFSKPPLTYWVIALSFVVFGRHEWAARIPNATAYFLTILCLFQIGKVLLPKRPWLPALVYWFFALPFAAANMVTTDTLLTLFTTMGIGGFVFFWWPPDGVRKRSWILAAWLAFGMAFLTKGPAGLLPLMAILAFVGLAEGRAGLKQILDPLGLALFLVTGLGWYIWVVSKSPNLLSYFFVDELFDRVASGKHRRNPQWYKPFVIYLPTLLIGTFPWTLGLFRCFPEGRETLRRCWRGDPARRASKDMFLICLILIPLVIFCVIQSRLPLYLMPIFPPLALLIGLHLKGPILTRKRIVWLALWGITLIALKGGASFYPYPRDSRALAHALKELDMGSPQELVFVESKPFYGLQLYLDCQIEVVAFQEPASDLFDSLRTEILQQEPNLLFVVREKHEAIFLKKLKDLKCTFRKRGEYQEYRFYTVTLEQDGLGHLDGSR